MPNAALKPCNSSGCPELVGRDALYGRCPRHSREYDLRRGSPKERGYTAAWSKFSRVWRRKYPLCGMRADGEMHAEHSRCVQQGLLTPAECVDHILSMANGGAQFDEKNLQSLCGRCNSAKRVTVDGAFGRGRKG